MKTKAIISTALLAMACMAMTRGSAFAKGGGGITVSDDDLILSIRATSGAGVSENLEYDLGNINAILAGTGSLPVNISADITTYFGGSNTGLLWSVVGTSFGSPASPDTTQNNLYYTVVTGGTPNPGPTALNGQAGPAGTLDSLYSGIRGQTGNTTALPGKGFAYSAAGNANGYTNLLTSNGSDTAQSFGYFNTSVENAVGASAQLYANIEGAGAPQLLGTFTLSSGDQLSFVQAIPEPSTYALLGIGSLALGFMARRRRMMVA